MAGRKSQLGIPYHPILFVLNSGDQLSKFFKRTGNDDFVVCLPVSDAIEFKVDEVMR